MILHGFTGLYWILPGLAEIWLVFAGFHGRVRGHSWSGRWIWRRGRDLTNWRQPRLRLGCCSLYVAGVMQYRRRRPRLRRPFSFICKSTRPTGNQIGPTPSNHRVSVKRKKTSGFYTFILKKFMTFLFFAYTLFPWFLCSRFFLYRQDYFPRPVTACSLRFISSKILKKWHILEA